MKTEAIIQDYYGAQYFLEAHSDKALTIFIVDDNKVYQKLLKNALKSPNNSIYTFDIGEDCLQCLDLKPDLVIIDYHLDGINPNALKGDAIAKMIEERSPNTEVVLISSDAKFKMLVDLKLGKAKNVMYKDNEAVADLQTRSSDSWKAKSINMNFRKSILRASLITLGAIGVIWLAYYLVSKYYVS